MNCEKMIIELIIKKNHNQNPRQAELYYNIYTHAILYHANALQIYKYTNILPSPSTPSPLTNFNVPKTFALTPLLVNYSSYVYFHNIYLLTPAHRQNLVNWILGNDQPTHKFWLKLSEDNGYEEKRNTLKRLTKG